MFENLVFITALLPIVLLVAAIASTRNINMATYTGKAILGTSILSAIAALIFISSNSQFETTSLGFEPVGTLLRFDFLSTTMFVMVSIIGFFVLRFCKNYLEGDAEHLTFIRRLLLTIALVQLLVISGSLLTLFVTWVLTSIGLQYLISFYRDRKGAQRAVKKKLFVARLSDLALLIAVILLYVEFKSGSLEVIFQGLKNMQADQLPLNLELAGLFVALAAIIKSVQVPFHGWVLDVMEAPTPVSALLHAGLLNAGPFLIIRFAYLIDLTTFAPLLLLLLGGISALYGTIVFPSQPSIKTSLAYSSIGHMGFSLMVCGMGLYSASLLHLVAHSFYKAHSFLSSGSAIDKHRLNQLKGNIEFKATIWNAATGFLITCILYLVISELWGGVAHHNFQFLVLGIIIIVGVFSYMIQVTSLENGLTTILKSTVIAGFVLLSFFSLESSIASLIGQQVPALSNPSTLIKMASIILLIGFIMTVFIPMFARTNTNKWETYRRNGFYLHVIFDRLVSSEKVKNTK